MLLVVVTKSVDDLLAWQSIEGHELLDFEMLGAKIASALNQEDHHESVLPKKN